jgi:hypothetical protein
MYPNRDVMIEALLFAAKTAAEGQTSNHPEDLEVSMTFAMETTAPVLMWLYENGHMK